MTGVGETAGPGRPAWQSAGTWRRWLRDYPLVPLTLLLLALVVVLWFAGSVNSVFFSNTIRAAVPLAILAACQTLTMLTGGIDLSVATIASMAAYVVASQAGPQGLVVAVILALGASAFAGLISGIGVGVFRVHPLIMTLGMGLIVLGVLTVYQRLNVASGARVPSAIVWLGGGSTGGIPHSLLLIVPLAAVIMLALRRSGYGRLLYAVGDNETAARLAGVRVWQVLIVLYVLSGLLAGIAGLAIAGYANAANATLADRYLLPSVAAAVIGGTSIFGGRGGYSGSIVGALILTVLGTLLNVLQMAEPVRQILFGAIILVVAAAYTRITEES